MNIYALQTARKGSKSVPNKNILAVNGHQLWTHNARAANNCDLIKKTYISTDIQQIHEIWNKTIKRPKHLCGDNGSHYETILHGLNYIENDIKDKVDILVILLGNNNGATKKDLKGAINALIKDPKADSIMSIGKYNMFNPYRAYKYKDGYAQTYVDQKITKKATKSNHNDKNAYGDTYFFNGSFWICRREAIINNNGLLPFPWIGKNILMWEQDASIMEVDAEWQLKLM